MRWNRTRIQRWCTNFRNTRPGTTCWIVWLSLWRAGCSRTHSSASIRRYCRIYQGHRLAQDPLLSSWSWHLVSRFSHRCHAVFCRDSPFHLLLSQFSGFSSIVLCVHHRRLEVFKDAPPCHKSSAISRWNLSDWWLWRCPWPTVMCPPTLWRSCNARGTRSSSTVKWLLCCHVSWNRTSGTSTNCSSCRLRRYGSGISPWNWTIKWSTTFCAVVTLSTRYRFRGWKDPYHPRSAQYPRSGHHCRSSEQPWRCHQHLHHRFEAVLSFRSSHHSPSRSNCRRLATRSLLTSRYCRAW